MTATEQEEPAEDRKTSLRHSFSQADMRVLVVTFAGTLGANVMTVVVVAAAVVVARGSPRTAGTVFQYLAVAAAGAVMTVVFTFLFRRTSRPYDLNGWVLAAIFGVFAVSACLSTLALLLGLVGVAVGMK